MEFTKYQLETLAIVQTSVLNSDVIKGVINRENPIDEKTLEDLLNSELKKAIENVQGYLLELMTGKHDDQLKEMAEKLYNKIIR